MLMSYLLQGQICACHAHISGFSVAICALKSCHGAAHDWVAGANLVMAAVSRQTMICGVYPVKPAWRFGLEHGMICHALINLWTQNCIFCCNAVWITSSREDKASCISNIQLLSTCFRSINNLNDLIILFEDMDRSIEWISYDFPRSSIIICNHDSWLSYACPSKTHMLLLVYWQKLSM